MNNADDSKLHHIVIVGGGAGGRVDLAEVYRIHVRTVEEVLWSLGTACCNKPLV